MAQLVLPNPPATDTLQAFASYAGQVAQALNIATSSFIDDLLVQRDVDFNAGEQLETLNYLQWDYDAEIALLQSLRPASVVIDTEETGADIDRLNAEVAPSAPTLDVPTAFVPTLDAERPSIAFPDRPGTDVGAAPTDAPNLDDVPVPDAPTLVLPPVPTFEELQLPVPPSVSLPSFDAQSPVNQLVAPTNNFDYVDPGYTSELRDPLVAKLLSDLENGGYGIEPADEDALFGRVRDRAEQAARLAVEEAQRRAANMSAPLPQGSLFADMERARREAQNLLADANRDIALRRSELFVENRRFTIEQVQQYERISIDLYNAIQERRFNFARAVTEIGIAIYDASVRNFNAQLEAYRTEATVFAERVRGELAKAELFKAQIEAENLRGQFNQQKVSLYQAQLNGIQTLVNLYKTRVDATAALTDVQRSKLEVFRSKVQVYGERVRAKAAEYDMYRSAVLGETAKLDIYRTDIQAHEARLRGEELRVRTALQSNEALIQTFRTAVERYRSRVDAVAKSVDSRLEQQKTGVAIASVNVASYRALTDAVLSGIESRRQAQRMNNDWNIAALNSRVDAAKMRLEQLKLTIASRVEIDKFGSKFYGDPLTATLASLNGLTVKTAT